MDIKDAKEAAGTADARIVQGPATVGMYVAGLIAQWGEEHCGASGYSRVGAVVGATHIQDAAGFRSRMPHTMFLVPGYGVQGGTAADAAALFNADGTGAVINSSRGIIAAWKKIRSIRRPLPGARRWTVPQPVRTVPQQQCGLISSDR